MNIFLPDELFLTIVFQTVSFNFLFWLIGIWDIRRLISQQKFFRNKQTIHKFEFKWGSLKISLKFCYFFLFNFFWLPYNRNYERGTLNVKLSQKSYVHLQGK